MPELTQAGNFRGQIIAYGLNEAQSKALAIGITVLIEEIWHDDEWLDWSEYQMEVAGDLWIIKKDGSINKRSAESLVKNAGWDGDLTSVNQGTWNPTPVAITVEEDAYKGNVRYRIAWLNDYNRKPSGGGNVDAETASSLQQRFGGQLRAIASAVPSDRPSRPESSEKPAERPESSPASESSTAPPPAGVPVGEDGIPF